MKAKKLIALAIVVMLSACGSGGGNTGGGGTVSPLPPANNWLQLEPASINLTAYEGHDQEFTVVAKSSKTIAQQINPVVVEPTGLLAGNGRIEARGTLEYVATLKLSDKLKVGTYASKLELRLCEDATPACSKPIEGSPWFIPITVTVKPGRNLTALSELPPLSSWNSPGGTPSKTSYAPIRLDPAKFNLRWIYDASVGFSPGPTPITIDNGMVFVNASGPMYRMQYLTAISEDSGERVWSTGSNCIGPAMAVGGKVFTVTDCGSSATIPVLKAYNARNGETLHEIKFSQFDSILSQLAGKDVYIFRYGGNQNGSQFMRIDSSTGKVVWNTKASPFGGKRFIDMSADDTFLYSGTEGSLAVTRLEDGKEVVSALPLNNECLSLKTMVGPQSKLHMLCGRDKLKQFGYDALSGSVIWTSDTDDVRAFALAGSTVYSLSYNEVQARNAADGQLLWKSPLAAADLRQLGSPRDMLLTDNLIFVSGDKGAIAIDLTTRKTVWSFPQGGKLGLSSKGVLYLADDNNHVAAINLQ